MNGVGKSCTDLLCTWKLLHGSRNLVVLLKKSFGIDELCVGSPGLGEPRGLLCSFFKILSLKAMLSLIQAEPESVDFETVIWLCTGKWFLPLKITSKSLDPFYVLFPYQEIRDEHPQTTFGDSMPSWAARPGSYWRWSLATKFRLVCLCWDCLNNYIWCLRLLVCLRHLWMPKNPQWDELRWSTIPPIVHVLSCSHSSMSPF